MKFLKILFSLFLVSIFSISKTNAQLPDPSVNGATINPAPNIFPGGTAVVFFNFLNISTTAIPLNAGNHINLTLSNLDVNGAFNAATNISGAGAAYFTFTYNTTTKTLTGTQNQLIPGLTGGQITFGNLKVTGSSDRSNPQNGLNVNVVFLGALNASTTNDNTSAFTYSAAGGPLAVHFLSFNGIKEGNTVKLVWQTASEVNSSHFEVLHSVDALTWENIGTVASSAANGAQQNYSLIHKNPANGINYYQLKEVSNDGNFSMSNIITIDFNISGISINTVYPNPFSDHIKVDVSSDRTATVQIFLTDDLGRIFASQNSPIQKGVNQVSINNLGVLASGIYTLHIQTPYTTQEYKLKK